ARSASSPSPATPAARASTWQAAASTSPPPAASRRASRSRTSRPASASGRATSHALQTPGADARALAQAPRGASRQAQVIATKPLEPLSRLSGAPRMATWGMATYRRRDLRETRQGTGERRLTKASSVSVVLCQISDSHTIARDSDRKGKKMHARLISFSGADPDKREQAIQTIRETVIPTLREYDGYAG